MGSPFEREQSEKVSNVISEQRPGGSGAGGGQAIQHSGGSAFNNKGKGPEVYI